MTWRRWRRRKQIVMEEEDEVGRGKSKRKRKKREGFRKHAKTGDEKTRAKRTRGQGRGMTEEGEKG